MNYTLGCNYWPLKGGLSLWREWDPKSVEEDFRQLHEMGITGLRVFPLWNDFQPISRLKGSASEWVVEGRYVENRHNAEELMSATCVSHLDEMVALAGKYELKLIVSLITGWMSGRQYYPPILENLPLIGHPLSLFLQVKLVEFLVSRYRGRPEIAAWEIGNEFNVIAEVKSQYEAWSWLYTITSTIRRCDPDTPLYSGMYNQSQRRVWTIEDAAQTCDMMTTHSYPLWTACGGKEDFRNPRSVLQSTAQQVVYGDLSGKPCLLEEIGSLNPMVGDEETVAAFMKRVLYSTWAHGGPGCYWWCAYDAASLTEAPYQWCTCERELGFFHEDRTPKKLAGVFTDFAAFLKDLPFAALPPRRIDAVCVMSQTGETWETAYGAFMLAKQAGLDLRFVMEGTPLPEAPLYLLPSLSGTAPIKDRYFRELLSRVEQGAALFITAGDALINFFDKLCGVRCRGWRQQGADVLTMNGKSYPLHRVNAVAMEPTTATVLGRDQDGEPCFICNRYGKGILYYLDAPLERRFAEQAQLFTDKQPDYGDIYRTVAADVLKERVSRRLVSTGITQHPLPDGGQLVVALNYRDKPVAEQLTLPEGRQLKAVLRGDRTLSPTIPAGEVWMGIIGN